MIFQLAYLTAVQLLFNNTIFPGLLQIRLDSPNVSQKGSIGFTTAIGRAATVKLQHSLWTICILQQCQSQAAKSAKFPHRQQTTLNCSFPFFWLLKT